MNKTQVVKINVNNLVHADWNYKTDGTEEQIQTLVNAITKAGSCGVLMVREIERDGKILFEVMDGNHRLTAIRSLQWESVYCENFGPIDQADAIVLTRQRNEQWFEDDKLKLINLYNEVVFEKYSVDELSLILPDDKDVLESYQIFDDLDWSDPELKGDKDQSDTGKIFFELTEEVLSIWEKWCERLKQHTDIKDKNKSFEFAIIEALNVPEENLSKK